MLTTWLDKCLSSQHTLCSYRGAIEHLDCIYDELLHLSDVMRSGKYLLDRMTKAQSREQLRLSLVLFAVLLKA